SDLLLVVPRPSSTFFPTRRSSDLVEPPCRDTVTEQGAIDRAWGRWTENRRGSCDLRFLSGVSWSSDRSGSYDGLRPFRPHLSSPLPSGARGLAGDHADAVAGALSPRLTPPDRRPYTRPHTRARLARRRAPRGGPKTPKQEVAT